MLPSLNITSFSGATRRVSILLHQTQINLLPIFLQARRKTILLKKERRFRLPFLAVTSLPTKAVICWDPGVAHPLVAVYLFYRLLQVRRGNAIEQSNLWILFTLLLAVGGMPFNSWRVHPASLFSRHHQGVELHSCLKLVSRSIRISSLA